MATPLGEHNVSVSESKERRLALVERLSLPPSLSTEASVSAKQLAAAERRDRNLRERVTPRKKKAIPKDSREALASTLAARQLAADEQHASIVEARAHKAAQTVAKAFRGAHEASKRAAERAALGAQKSAEKQARAAKNLAELSARKVRVARELAGGDTQGKKAREAKINAERDLKIEAMRRANDEKLARAAERAATITQQKIDSAKKLALSRKESVDKMRAEAELEARRQLDYKQTKAAALNKEVLDEKVDKARKEIAKCDEAKKKKKLGELSLEEVVIDVPPQRDAAPRAPEPTACLCFCKKSISN